MAAHILIAFLCTYKRLLLGSGRRAEQLASDEAPLDVLLASDEAPLYVLYRTAPLDVLHRTDEAPLYVLLASDEAPLYVLRSAALVYTYRCSSLDSGRPGGIDGS